MAAELHAEISLLRNELESTRAVAARLAELRRSRTVDPAAALVPVRSSTRVTFWQAAAAQATPPQAAAPQADAPPSGIQAAAGRRREKLISDPRGSKRPMDDKLTRKSQEALSAAIRQAAANGNPQVEPAAPAGSRCWSRPTGRRRRCCEAVGADPAAASRRRPAMQIGKLPRRTAPPPAPRRPRGSCWR